jgi:hypothetical protein
LKNLWENSWKKYLLHNIDPISEERVQSGNIESY